MASCELNEIFLGEIASVQNYGAFVRIPGCKQQGLIHKTQVSSSRVDDVAQVLQRGERVWCKVININDDGKVGLSMKLVNQGNGKDLDPNGIERQLDEQRRKKMVPGQKKVIELQAILNTTCSKCGTRGHLASDCFMTPDGKKYDLIPEIEEYPLTEIAAPIEDKKEEKRVKKLKKRKRSKKSRQRSDEGSDDDNDSENDDDEDVAERKSKKRKKKRSRESKKKRRKRTGDESTDGDTSDNGPCRETKARRDGDKKSKKCKHSRFKHSD